MIKLTRGETPEFLTMEKTVELTEKFKSSGTSVWNNSNIKIPLLRSSNGKCAYCECSLTTESNYMEVEHFEDKKHNPEKVVKWDNLLPSCKKCNGAKGSHNVNNEPIVNPYLDDPREHIALRLYRFRGKTSIGERTIDVTNLNHSERLVFSRFLIGEKISELINIAWERFDLYQIKKDSKTRNRLLGVIEGLLKECQKSAAYAASSATILLTDYKFIELVQAMKLSLVWNEDLETLLVSAKDMIFECI